MGGCYEIQRKNNVTAVEATGISPKEAGGRTEANLEIPQYTQQKIQEALDNAAFSNLLGNQTSNRKNTHLLSIRCLYKVLGFPHLKSLAWTFTLSQINSEPLWRIGLVFSSIMRNENFCSVKTEYWTRFRNHALGCHFRRDADYMQYMKTFLIII